MIGNVYEIRFANADAAAFVARRLRAHGWQCGRAPRSSIVSIQLGGREGAAEEADRLCSRLRKEWDERHA